MISASQCHKLCSLLDKNQNVCKSVTSIRKDPAYQFSYTATQLKYKRKIDHSVVCWHFQMIFASQCYKLCNLLHKNQNVCKSFTTVRKDPAYQFSCTATKLNCKRKIDHSAVSWHFQMIFSSQCDKLFILLEKNKSVFKSVTIIRKDPAYQFSPKVQIFKYSRKLTTSLSVDIFRWFLCQRVPIHLHFQTKIKKCSKVPW